MQEDTVFGEYMKDKQTCLVYKYNSVVGRDKNCLLSKLVNYDWDSVKLRE